ncbi:hypothetical protein B0H66DRAFT_575586 [Apodospora peruviana]|uniref:Uncharacterized protein n=1 Tax=Apodospora peruviana TaxID=516989 RepID=A0AAE0M4J7_9PEZI|nr:hypothetical protein B0H66DRAFT_575586 [Apodospora peruviana]
MSQTSEFESIAEADEYARCNGLTIDCLSNRWPGLVDHDEAIATTLTKTEPGELIELQDLQECLFRPIIPMPDHWQVPLGSLKLLGETCKPCKEGEIVRLTTQLCFPWTSESKTLKIEPPILQSDHDADCQHLARKVEAYLAGPLPDHRLPLHPTDVDKDEGLKFPTRARIGNELVMKSLGRETIKVNRKTLAVLVHNLKAEWTSADQKEFVEGLWTYNGLGCSGYVTPPLSPCLQPQTEPIEYFVPSEAICQVPEPSTPSSDINAEIEAAECSILKDDYDFWATRYANIDIPGMIKTGNFSSPKSSPAPIPPDLLKVDVPLMPDDSIGDRQKTPARVITPHDLSKARELISTSSDELSGDSNAVMRSAEQEKLEPLDGTARVSIPVMDFSIPKPDWDEQLSGTPEGMFKWIRENTDVDWKDKKWPNNRTAEQRMVWVPLAHMGQKKLVSEKIEAAPSIIEAFCGRTKDHEVMTSADCIEKQPGLTFLRQNDGELSDDEILEEEPTSTGISSKSLTSGLTKSKKRASPLPDLSELLRGKKRQLEEELQKQKSTAEKTESNKLMTSSTPLTSNISTLGLREDSTGLKVFMDMDINDHRSLTDQHIEISRPKKPKLTHRPYFDTEQQQATKAAAEAALMSPPPKPMPALAPDIMHPKTPPTVIVAFSVSPVLKAQLEKLLPGIRFIVRDYDKHRPSGWYPGMLPNADEADITVSPITGIMLTTLVKLRQRPLPGKIGQVIFRHIVRNVALRYERLVILVNEGNKYSESMSPLSQSDANALVDLQGFAIGLQTEVHVIYAGGGNATLVKWVAALICNYTPETQRAEELLLEEETFWELFLRRAGMNVYAAQVVLAEVKPPDGEPAMGRGHMHGLPVFVTMTPEERIVMFEDVLRGRKLLNRVSEAIDEPWGQHAVEGKRNAEDEYFSP